MAKVINKTKTYKPVTIYPLILPEERLANWKEIKGIWENYKPDPIKELKKMRKRIG